jgi:hypothetical protein
MKHVLGGNMTSDLTDDELDLTVLYADHPRFRALVQLIPYASAADSLIMHSAERTKRARLRAFFNELEGGRIPLTPELIESDDFIHCFQATLRAATRARRLEKVRLFARLLEHGMMASEAQSVDDYEELVGVLDELSYREWQALMLFERYLENSNTEENQLSRVTAFWDQFIEDLELEIGVSRDEASSFMIRIARTGLYIEITGAYLDYTGGLGITTPRLRRLMSIMKADLDLPTATNSAGTSVGGGA